MHTAVPSATIAPMKLLLDSIGCRLNHSEMETLARQMMANGHQIVTDAAEADKVVINTCAVTAEATRDARSRTRTFYRANPQAESLMKISHRHGTNTCVAYRKTAGTRCAARGASSRRRAGACSPGRMARGCARLTIDWPTCIAGAGKKEALHMLFPRPSIWRFIGTSFRICMPPDACDCIVSK